jgi:hypothetical protein
MNLQQLKKQAEEDIKQTLGGHLHEEKVYFENDKELMQFDIFGFVYKYIDLTAKLYEQKKYWCPACEDYENVKDDGDICCLVCGMIITSYE